MGDTVNNQRSTATLTAALDRAVDAGECRGVCEAVKNALVRLHCESGDCLDTRLVRPSPDGYARRLLHHDPEDRYSVVVMTWGLGQGTPIHDHDGRWCVECVFRGTIRVTSYRLLGDPSPDTVDFAEDEVIHAGAGEAGHLIPPYEHHRIENAGDEPAVTVHVYSGEMKSCNVYLPTDDGRWQRTEKALTYTP